MTDTNPGSPGYNQPTPPTTPDNNSTPETSETGQDSDGKLNVAEESRKTAEASNKSPHRLTGDPVAKAEAFEEKRKTDLDEARAEHMRMRSGGDVDKK